MQGTVQKLDPNVPPKVIKASHSLNVTAGWTVCLLEVIDNRTAGWFFFFFPDCTSKRFSYYRFHLSVLCVHLTMTEIYKLLWNVLCFYFSSQRLMYMYSNNWTVWSTILFRGVRIRFVMCQSVVQPQLGDVECDGCTYESSCSGRGLVIPLHRREVGEVLRLLWLLFGVRRVQNASAAWVLHSHEVKSHYKPDICSGLIVHTELCSKY